MMRGIVRLLGEDSATDQSLPDGRGFREATPKSNRRDTHQGRSEPIPTAADRRKDARPGSPVQGTCEDRTISS